MIAPVPAIAIAEGDDMRKRLVVVLAWMVRAVVICVILAIIVLFLIVCGLAVGIGGGM